MSGKRFKSAMAIVTAAATVVLTSSLASGQSAHGAPAGSGNSVSSADCERIDNSVLWHSAKVTDQAGEAVHAPEFTEWISAGTGAESMARIEQAVASLSIQPAGIAADHGGKTVRISLWPEDRSRSQPLSELVSAIDPPFAVDVREACISSSESRAAQRALRERLKSLGIDPSFAVSTEPSTGLVEVTVPDAAEQSITALAAEFNSSALFVSGSITRVGRYDDANPHYGAASISNGSVVCTSNSAVVGFLGIVAMPTAGHCTISPASAWTSGPYAYGNRIWTSPDYPLHDVGILAAIAGQTFTNTVHVEPCCPSTRIVNGVRNGAIYESVCISGQSSHANCSFIMSTNDNSQSFTDAAGTTFDLDAAVAPLATQACIPGDSGGIMYRPKSGGTADIEGLVVAMKLVPEYGIRVCLFHDPFVVQSVTSTTYRLF